MKIDRES
jgi:hypothetical protein